MGGVERVIETGVNEEERPLTRRRPLLEAGSCVCQVRIDGEFTHSVVIHARG